MTLIAASRFCYAVNTGTNHVSRTNILRLLVSSY